MYGAQNYDQYGSTNVQYDQGQGSSGINYNPGYGQVQQNVNLFSPAAMDEPATPSGSTSGRGRTTRSSRGGRGGGVVGVVAPMGKRGAAAAAAAAIAQRAASSPEHDVPMPTPSPAQRRGRGRPKKSQVGSYVNLSAFTRLLLVTIILTFVPINFQCLKTVYFLCLI